MYLFAFWLISLVQLCGKGSDTPLEILHWDFSLFVDIAPISPIKTERLDLNSVCIHWTLISYKDLSHQNKLRALRQGHFPWRLEICYIKSHNILQLERAAPTNDLHILVKPQSHLLIKEEIRAFDGRSSAEQPSTVI